MPKRNIFQDRRKQIDEASGWSEPKPKPVKKPVKKKPAKTRGY